MSWWQSPGLILLLTAALLPLIAPRLRDGLALGAGLAALLLCWFFPQEGRLSLFWLDHEFILQEARPFSRIFAVAFSLALTGGCLFAWGQNRHRELTAALLLAGSALMIVFAGDLLVLLLFWEVMAIASTLILWFGGAGGQRASLRYALMHLLGGMLLMQGVALAVYLTGGTGLPGFALDFHSLHAAASVPMDASAVLHNRVFMADLAIWLIFGGILVNLAAPPFSAWLPDAYAQASPSGAVFLSAFTTKTAVYVLMTLFAGTPLLIGLGLFMIFYGILYAVLESDLRRVLCYSIVTQVGFMVVGIGVGSPLALYGVAALAFCHILYKSLLMMTAGAVLQQTGGIHRLGGLGGLYHSMPVTTLCALIGAFTSAAMPLTAAFVSKSMLTGSVAQAGMGGIYLLLLAAGAGAFLHAGGKYPWFVFFQRDSGLRPRDPAPAMQWAMGLFALLCLLPGIFPSLLYALLPTPPDFEAHTAAHWVQQWQTLLFAGLAFCLLLPWLGGTRQPVRDMDWLYRVLLLRVVNYLWFILLSLRWGTLLAGFHSLRYVGGRLRGLHQPTGLLARTVPVGDAATWVGILLAIYLLSYYSAGN